MKQVWRLFVVAIVVAALLLPVGSSAHELHASLAAGEDETLPAAADTACQDEIEVTSVGDAGPGTLRQALADLCDEGVITFADEPTDSDSFYIDLTSGELAIDKQVVIRKTTVPSSLPELAGASA